MDKKEILNDIDIILEKYRKEGKEFILTTEIIKEFKGYYYNSSFFKEEYWEGKLIKFLMENKKLFKIEEEDIKGLKWILLK